MDFRVSRKEKMYQPRGPVMVLVDDVFDLFPVYGNPFDPTIITDIECITNPGEEVLDRAMFSIVKQRGLDPVDMEDGIQWSEYILGEVPAGVILMQVQDAVHAEGPAVRLTPQPTSKGTSFAIELTNTRGVGL